MVKTYLDFAYRRFENCFVPEPILKTQYAFCVSTFFFKKKNAFFIEPQFKLFLRHLVFKIPPFMPPLYASIKAFSSSVEEPMLDENESILSAHVKNEGTGPLAFF